MLLLHMSLAFTVDEGHQFRHRVSWGTLDGPWKPEDCLYSFLPWKNNLFLNRGGGNTLNICLPFIFHAHHHLPKWPIHSIKWPKIGTPKRQKIETIHLAAVVLRHWPLVDSTTILYRPDDLNCALQMLPSRIFGKLYPHILEGEEFGSLWKWDLCIPLL